MSSSRSLLILVAAAAVLAAAGAASAHTPTPATISLPQTSPVCTGGQEHVEACLLFEPIGIEVFPTDIALVTSGSVPAGLAVAIDPALQPNVQPQAQACFGVDFTGSGSPAGSFALVFVDQRANLDLAAIPVDVSCAPAPVCGDGVVNQASEQCDPPGGACGRIGRCDADCLCRLPQPTCGNGAVDQQDEQCDDGNDVDGDGCSAACQIESPVVHPCNHPCPSRITRGAAQDTIELFLGFRPTTPVDPAHEPIVVRLSNASGTIFDAALAAGSLRKVGERLLQFRDLGARRTGGVSRARIVRRHNGLLRLHLLAHGDFSAATDPNLLVQIQIGDDVAVTDQPWTPRAGGFVLNLAGH